MSDNTYIIINIHSLTHILDICVLIFRSCALFIVYPNRNMQRHPTALQVITTRARGAVRKNTGPIKWPLETHSVIYVPGLSTLSDLLRIDVHRISLLPKPTYTPSIQPNLDLPRTRSPLTSAINTLVAIRYSSILSTCPNHLITL